MTTTPVPTITDDLLAEIELDFQSARKLGREAYIDMQDGEALIARLRAAEVDAVRLEFLARECAAIDTVSSFDGFKCYRIVWPYRSERPLSLRRDSLREVIDAAMQEASK